MLQRLVRMVVGLSPLPRVIALLGVVIFGLASWGLRVDGLRAGHLDEKIALRDQLGQAAGAIAVATKGKAPAFDQIAAGIGNIAASRATAQRERDSARAALAAQSEGVARLQAEARRLQTVSDKNRRLADAMADERNVWIVRARQAATRDQRLACERELEEIDAVLDLLYRSGF